MVFTKPICERCDRSLFWQLNKQKNFALSMQSTQKKMFLRHPMLAFKHKMKSWGVDYAKHEQEKKQADKS